MAARLVVTFSIGHLRSLAGLLENDHKLTAFRADRLELLVDYSKSTARRLKWTPERGPWIAEVKV
jgi:hypothetical protein